jgi:hypothetical protein
VKNFENTRLWSDIAICLREDILGFVGVALHPAMPAVECSERDETAPAAISACFERV